MRRLVIFALLLMAASAYAVLKSGETIYVRPAGSDQVALGHSISLDSSDSFVIDTIWSDSVLVDPTKEYFLVGLIRGHVTLCDSCNDSMIVKVVTYSGMVDAGYSKVIDSFSFARDTTRDTANRVFYISPATAAARVADSTVWQKVWWATVISDSVKTNKGAKTNIIPLEYYVLQR